jgi:hypothetical protein
VHFQRKYYHIKDLWNCSQELWPIDNRGGNKSYFTTDSVSQSMSWYRAPLWDLRPDIISCRTVAVWNLRSIGRPLWREDGSTICSVIKKWSESLGTRNHTLLSHLRLPQPGGPGSRIYPPGIWKHYFSATHVTPLVPQLYSRRWVDPVPDPLLLRKSGSARNRTRASGSVARNSGH